MEKTRSFYEQPPFLLTRVKKPFLTILKDPEVHYVDSNVPVGVLTDGEDIAARLRVIGIMQEIVGFAQQKRRCDSRYPGPKFY